MDYQLYQDPAFSGQNSSNPFQSPQNQQYYVGMVQHVLLLFLTFGIYYWVWIYRMSKFMYEDQEDRGLSPVANLVLCMLVPYYQLYWYYKLIEKLDKYYAIAGKPYDRSMNTALAMILAALVAGMVAAVLVQDNVNQLVGMKPKTVTCKSCGQTFVNDHDQCPHCGAAYKTPLIRKPWFIVLLVMAACGVLAAILFGVSSARNAKTYTYSYYGGEQDGPYNYYDDQFNHSDYGSNQLMMDDNQLYYETA